MSTTKLSDSNKKRAIRKSSYCMTIICLFFLINWTAEVSLSLTQKITSHQVYIYDYEEDKIVPEDEEEKKYLDISAGKWIYYPQYKRLEFHPFEATMLIFNPNDPNKFIYLEAMRIVLAFNKPDKDQSNPEVMIQGSWLNPDLGLLNSVSAVEISSEKYLAQERNTRKNQNLKMIDLIWEFIFSDCTDYQSLSSQIATWNYLPFYEFTKPEYMSGDYYNHILYFAGKNGQVILGKIVENMEQFPKTEDITSQLSQTVYINIYKKIMMRYFRHMIMQDTEKYVIPKSNFLLNEYFTGNKSKVEFYENLLYTLDLSISQLCVEYLKKNDNLEKIKTFEELLREIVITDFNSYFKKTPLTFLKDVFRVVFNGKFPNMTYIDTIIRLRKIWRHKPKKYKAPPANKETLMIYEDPGLKKVITRIMNEILEDELEPITEIIDFFLEDSKEIFKSFIDLLNQNIQKYEEKLGEDPTLESRMEQNVESFKINTNKVPDELTFQHISGYLLKSYYQINSLKVHKNGHQLAIKTLEELGYEDFLGDFLRFDYFPFLVGIYEDKLLKEILSLKQFKESGIDLLSENDDISTRSLYRFYQMLGSVGIIPINHSISINEEFSKYVGMNVGNEETAIFNVSMFRNLLI